MRHKLPSATIVNYNYPAFYKRSCAAHTRQRQNFGNDEKLQLRPPRIFTSVRTSATTLKYNLTTN